MASVSLTMLYCLNLTLSNGGIKSFGLQPPIEFKWTGLYYTPADCGSENGFWLRHDDAFMANFYHARWESRLDFIHHKHLGRAGKITANEWTAQCVSRSTETTVAINGNKLLQFKPVGLNDGDAIQIKYPSMKETLNFSNEGVTVKTPISTLNQTESTMTNLKETESMAYEQLVEIEELVMVLNVRIETLKNEVEQLKKGQATTNTSSSSTLLVVFTIMAVLAISFVLGFIIYKSRLQTKKIDTLSMDVTRFRNEIQ